MANLVKKLYQYLDGQLEDAIARHRKRKIDERWLDEFSRLYEWRVEHGLSREEADRAYDGLLSTELSNIWLSDHHAELDASRAEMHWAIDRRIQIDRTCALPNWNSRGTE